MHPTTAPNTPPQPQPAPLAAFLTWIVPGLGYIIHNEPKRAALVASSIIALIAAGLLIGGPDTIDSKNERWWFLIQAAAGPIVITADQIHQRLLKVPAQGIANHTITPHPDPNKNPGSNPPKFTKSVARVNESARLYIVIAGMLNLIAIIDCAYRAPKTNQTPQPNPRPDSKPKPAHSNPTTHQRA